MNIFGSEYQALTRRGDRLEACGTTYPVFRGCEIMAFSGQGESQATRCPQRR